MCKSEVAICLMLALQCCAVVLGSPTKRVVGGELVLRGEAKFSVSLWYKKPNPFTINTGLDHVCGGTLIADRWVLTSAHCFDEAVFPGLSLLGDWEVVLGENKQNVTEDGEQKFIINQLFVSPLYNMSVPTGDVALLYLNASVQTDDYANTIGIDEDTDCAVEGTTCTVYGWGQVQEEPYGSGSVQQYKAEVKLWSNQKCAEAYSGMYSITRNEMCASDQGHDACFGDSGGPLICSCSEGPAVSGIVFTGHGCARADYPGVYERVSVFASWIKSTVERLTPNDDDDADDDDHE